MKNKFNKKDKEFQSQLTMMIEEMIKSDENLKKELSLIDYEGGMTMRAGINKQINLIMNHFNNN